MKRLNQVTALKIEAKGRQHLVILEKLKNDVNGNPRYKAIIVFLDSDCLYNAVYTFKGHYCGDKGEAEFIVNRYYEEIKKTCKE